MKVELVISDRTDDLVAEGADMALRLGRPVDSGFGARLLASAPRLVIAAPAYLAQRGAPETLADLSQHDCIVGPGLSGRSGWSFTRAGAVTSVVVEGRSPGRVGRRRDGLREGRPRHCRRIAMDVPGRTPTRRRPSDPAGLRARTRSTSTPCIRRARGPRPRFAPSPTISPPSSAHDAGS